ncbi:hypothetical protein U0070_009202 [Myodes glareolus]|uniref:Uncharacterized protein n=1 Tax=Myodes glareolus TaxID=447135 RepID=A0AAW0H8C2_MYOGA
MDLDLNYIQEEKNLKVWLQDGSVGTDIATKPVLILKLIPMVEMKVVLKASSEKRNRRQVFADAGVTDEQQFEKIIVCLHHLLALALSDQGKQGGKEVVERGMEGGLGNALPILDNSCSFGPARQLSSKWSYNFVVSSFGEALLSFTCSEERFASKDMQRLDSTKQEFKSNGFGANCEEVSGGLLVKGLIDTVGALHRFPQKQDCSSAVDLRRHSNMNILQNNCHFTNALMLEVNYPLKIISLATSVP